MGLVTVAFTDNERRYQLCLRVQADESPNVAIEPGPASVLLLRADESPNLIHFDLEAAQAAHLGIEDLLAAFANTHAKPHDGIAVDARNPLNASDAGTFAEHGNRHHFLVSRKDIHNAEPGWQKIHGL